MRPLIGTSTKMNLTSSESTVYFRVLLPLVADIEACDLFVLPPFTSLWVAREMLSGSNVNWGAQDVHPEESGAHTGDISAQMLEDLGCSYVEVGHFERRRDHGETDSLVAAKVQRVLAHAMTPILCVGEPEEGPTELASKFVVEQLRRGLALVDATELQRVVVAYEPGWAIGANGRCAGPAHVGTVHRAIREWLSPAAGVLGARVIYGGSVRPSAADGLLAEQGVDGLFVGRAALDPKVFARLALSAARVAKVGKTASTA